MDVNRPVPLPLPSKRLKTTVKSPPALLAERFVEIGERDDDAAAAAPLANRVSLEHIAAFKDTRASVEASLQQMRDMETLGYTLFDVGSFDELIYDITVLENFFKYETPDSDGGPVVAVFRDKDGDGGKQLRQLVVPVPYVSGAAVSERNLDSAAVAAYTARTNSLHGVRKSLEKLAAAAVASIPLHLRGRHTIAGCAFLGNFSPLARAVLRHQMLHIDQRIVPFAEPPPIFVIALRQAFNLIIYPKSKLVLQELVDVAAMLGNVTGIDIRVDADDTPPDNADVADIADIADIADVIVSAKYNTPEFREELRPVKVHVAVGKGVMLSGNTVHCSHRAEVDSDGDVVMAARAHVFAQNPGTPYPQEDDVTHFLDNLAPGLMSDRVAALFRPYGDDG
jgi:hypothetical protein